jgi:hypothetical protein
MAKGKNGEKIKRKVVGSTPARPPVESSPLRIS